MNRGDNIQHIGTNPIPIKIIEAENLSKPCQQYKHGNGCPLDTFIRRHGDRNLYRQQTR